MKTIIIYRLNTKRAVEIDRWQDGKFKGIFKDLNISREEVIKKFNRGYYRTSEI